MKYMYIIVLLGSPVLFGADEPTETFGLKNGRFWNLLQAEHKILFLIGMKEGWTLRGRTEETVKGKVINALTASGTFSDNDLEKMLTSIYAEPENVEIPVGWAVLGSLASQRGDTTREAVLMALRKFVGSDRNCSPCRNSDFDPLDTIQKAGPK